MSRHVCLLIILAATPAMGGDYLLTVERVETVTTEEEGHSHVEKTSQQTLEVLCRPGMPFLGRVIEGPETTTVAGELQEVKDGKVRIKISFSHSVDTGLTVLTPSGVREKVMNFRSTRTTVELVPGVPLISSGIISRKMDETTGGAVESTEQSVRILVRKHPPAVEAKKPYSLRD